MKFALLVIAACVTEVDVPHEYACNATFWCDGVPYELSDSHACATEDNVDLAYRDRLEDITKDARCTVKTYDVRCRIVGDTCVR